MLNISDFTFDMGIIQHLCQHTATPMFIRVRFVVSEQINKQTDELIKFSLNTHSHTHEEIWREGKQITFYLFHYYTNRWLFQLFSCLGFVWCCCWDIMAYLHIVSRFTNKTLLQMTKCIKCVLSIPKVLRL